MTRRDLAMFLWYLDRAPGPRSARWRLDLESWVLGELRRLDDADRWRAS